MSITDPIPTVNAEQWGADRGRSKRTVLRWLQAGEIPDAHKVDGEWQIPYGAERILRPTITPAAEVVAINQAKRGQGQAMALPEPLDLRPALGALLTLEDAATQLHTTVGGIRRLGDAGHMVIGKFGPNGSLRVYLS